MKHYLTSGIVFLCFSICSFGQDADWNLSNLHPTAINLSLVPKVDSSIDLGTFSKGWKKIYLRQGLYLDGTIFMHNGTRYSNAFLGYEAGAFNTTGGANTGIGFRALANNTTGDFNTATGLEALYSNSTGNANVATGYGALHANTTGGANVAAGNAALYLNTTGSWNVAEGANTMIYNTTGSNNVASGSYAMWFNTTGNNNVGIGSAALAKSTTLSNLVAIGNNALSSLNGGLGRNTAVGSQAASKLTTGNYSTYIGWQSGYNSTTGNANTAVGAASLLANTTGTGNVASGSQAMSGNTTGNNNVAVGVDALATSSTLSNLVAIGDHALTSLNGGQGGNTAVGSQAATKLTTGNYSTYIGWQSGYNSTTGNANTAMGAASLLENKTGYDNIAMGVDALRYNTTGSYNTIIGKGAGYANTTGSANVSLGVRSLFANTTGINLVAIGDSAFFSLNGGLGGNTAVGSKAGTNLTTGNFSTYIGWKSGYNGTTANANTAVGAASLFSNITGYDNIAVGVDALEQNTTGSYNTIVGKGAGFANTTGRGNVSLGVRSLYSNISGMRNTAIGDSAGYANKGNYNTFLGAFADVTTNELSNATAIGYNAKVSTSNTIVLGDANTATNVAIGATTSGVFKLKVAHGTYGFDLSNAITGNNWEHFVSGGAGTTAGGAALTSGDMLLYYNNSVLPVGAFDHTSGAYKTVSDERMKTNIKPMTSILDKINLLEPVTYNFKNGSNENTSLGFTAQKVEKLFPSLVTHYEDTARGTDVRLMDYSGFGVIAIKGIQELQQQMQDKDTTINYQQRQIDELKNMLLALQQKVESCSPCSSSNVQPANKTSVILTNTASLAQNIPNPFTNTTVINYTLPQKFSNAQIVITDNSGKTIKQVNVSGAGKGSLTVDASTLASGAYSYSLFVDGRLNGTKKMILAK